MEQRLLFQKVPATLFAPLAAPAAVMYSAALLRLFTETQLHLEPLSWELCVSQVVEAIEDQSLDEQLALPDNGVTASTIVDEEEARGNRDRATEALRYLRDCQWLREEIREDGSIVYSLPEHAFRILRVLNEMATEREERLQGIICSIHDLLQAAVREGNASVRVPQACQDSRRLLSNLKELQHTIGLQIEQVLAKSDSKAILEQTFTTYLHQVTRRAYHELRTTDHVSRFRPGIFEAIAKLRSFYLNAASEAVEAATAEDGARLNGRRPVESISGQQLLGYLDEIQAHFDQLDEVLQAIDLRHSQFFDAAVRSIQQRLSAHTSTSGHVHTLLVGLLERQEQARKDESEEEVLGELSELFSLHELQLLEAQSLMQPRRAAEAFTPGPELSTELTPEVIAQARQRTLAQLSRAYSRERIRQFADGLLGPNDERYLSDVPLKGAEDLPLLIYLRLYGREREAKLGYRTEELDEAPWIEIAGIGFRDFRIRRVDEDE